MQFGKVFVINLKERTDKLDAIQMAASLTDFQLDVIEGVRGTEISNKSMPTNGVPDVSCVRASIPTVGMLTIAEERPLARERLQQYRRMLALAHQFCPDVSDIHHVISWDPSLT